MDDLSDSTNPLTRDKLAHKKPWSTHHYMVTRATLEKIPSRAEDNSLEGFNEEIIQPEKKSVGRPLEVLIY